MAVSMRESKAHEHQHASSVTNELVVVILETKCSKYGL